MEYKLTKLKLYTKKYGLYVLLALSVFLIFFIFTGNGKDNLWLRTVKKLMDMINKVQDDLHQIHETGQKKEDDIRHGKEDKDVQINTNAAKAQADNDAKLAGNITQITEDTKDDPNKMAEAFQNTFGIPRGDNK